jgi:hypothetical protein
MEKEVTMLVVYKKWDKSSKNFRNFSYNSGIPGMLGIFQE